MLWVFDEKWAKVGSDLLRSRPKRWTGTDQPLFTVDLPLRRLHRHRAAQNPSWRFYQEGYRPGGRLPRHAHYHEIVCAGLCPDR